MVELKVRTTIPDQTLFLQQGDVFVILTVHTRNNRLRAPSHVSKVTKQREGLVTVLMVPGPLSEPPQDDLRHEPPPSLSALGAPLPESALTLP